MNYSEELIKIEKQVEEAKIKKAKLEERLTNLEKEQVKVEKEIKENDTTPENLIEEIEKLEKEIQEGIEQCQKQLN